MVRSDRDSSASAAPEDRVEILAEIVRERLPHVQRLIEEWSVPESDPVSYAQMKDLIWQAAAPLGLSLLGFRAVEHAHLDDPGNIDLRQAASLFSQVGSDTGDIIERFLQAAAGVRP